MVHELVDQLDESGNFVRVIDKEIAHQNGLWHKSIHVWIMNDKNEVLLQYRCAEKKFFPNVWDVSFAGHVGASESSIDAVIREGKEELGIDVDLTKLDFLFTAKEHLTYGNIVSNEFVDVFLLKDNFRIQDLVLQEIEVGGVKYIPTSQYIKDINADSEKYLPHKGMIKQLKKAFIKSF